MKPKNTIACLLLTGLLLVNMLSLSLVKGAYELNRAYVARYLCENTATPEKKCEGHCFLNKSLDKAAEASSDGNDFRGKKPSTEFIALAIALPEQPAQTPEPARYSPLLVPAYNHYEFSLLQPPQ